VRGVEGVTGLQPRQRAGQHGLIRRGRDALQLGGDEHGVHGRHLEEHPRAERPGRRGQPGGDVELDVRQRGGDGGPLRDPGEWRGHLQGAEGQRQRASAFQRAAARDRPGLIHNGLLAWRNKSRLTLR
jgi:hypothetical protein